MLIPRCSTLVADPPWLHLDQLPGETRGATNQYPCMPTNEIARFPLPPMLDDCWLFLWYVTSMLEDARLVCRVWGFEPTGGELVWVKTTGEGMFVVDPIAVDGMNEQELQMLLDIGGTRLAFGMGRTVRNARDLFNAPDRKGGRTHCLRRSDSSGIQRVLDGRRTALRHSCRRGRRHV